MNYENYQKKVSSIVKSIMSTVESYEKLSDQALDTIRKMIYAQVDNNFKYLVDSDNKQTLGNYFHRES